MWVGAKKNPTYTGAYICTGILNIPLWFGFEVDILTSARVIDHVASELLEKRMRPFGKGMVPGHGFGHGQGFVHLVEGALVA